MQSDFYERLTNGALWVITNIEIIVYLSSPYPHHPTKKKSKPIYFENIYLKSFVKVNHIRLAVAPVWSCIVSVTPISCMSFPTPPISMSLAFLSSPCLVVPYSASLSRCTKNHSIQNYIYDSIHTDIYTKRTYNSIHTDIYTKRIYDSIHTYQNIHKTSFIHTCTNKNRHKTYIAHTKAISVPRLSHSLQILSIIVAPNASASASRLYIT